MFPKTRYIDFSRELVNDPVVQPCWTKFRSRSKLERYHRVKTIFSPRRGELTFIWPSDWHCRWSESDHERNRSRSTYKVTWPAGHHSSTHQNTFSWWTYPVRILPLHKVQPPSLIKGRRIKIETFQGHAERISNHSFWVIYPKMNFLHNWKWKFSTLSGEKMFFSWILILRKIIWNKYVQIFKNNYYFCIFFHSC